MIETIEQYLNRGGRVKILTPKKAKGSERFKKPFIPSHFGTKKTHAYWKEEKTDEIQILLRPSLGG